MEWYVPLLRTVGPMVSFTNGAAGGIFAPSLSAGASIGSVFSGWFQMSDSNSNLMILSGMVGFLTGITRSPFTSSILVLEMTTADEIIFYLMLAGLASNMMARLVDRRSFYDQLKEQYIEELTHSEAANP
jgi:H+/Cl- antiporter ClcA